MILKIAQGGLPSTQEYETTSASVLTRNLILQIELLLVHFSLNILGSSSIPGEFPIERGRKFQSGPSAPSSPNDTSS